MILEVGKFYWVRLNKGVQWLPAERINTDYGGGWYLTGIDAEYYDREIAKVGPEIVPPADDWEVVE